MMLQLEAERFRAAVLAKTDVPCAIETLYNDLQHFTRFVCGVAIINLALLQAVCLSG